MSSTKSEITVRRVSKEPPGIIILLLLETFSENFSSEAEFQRIVEVFNDAFETGMPFFVIAQASFHRVNAEIFIGYILGGYNGHLKTPSLMSEFNRAVVHAGLVGGQLYVAELPDVGIVGAAIWYGPGEAFFST